MRWIDGSTGPEEKDETRLKANVILFTNTSGRETLGKVRVRARSESSQITYSRCVGERMGMWNSTFNETSERTRDQ